jgi:hypothetical protein
MNRIPGIVIFHFNTEKVEKSVPPTHVRTTSTSFLFPPSLKEPEPEPTSQSRSEVAIEVSKVEDGVL